jgi:hypothetical protein
MPFREIAAQRTAIAPIVQLHSFPAHYMHSDHSSLLVNELQEGYQSARLASWWTLIGLLVYHQPNLGVESWDDSKSVTMPASPIFLLSIARACRFYGWQR